MWHTNKYILSTFWIHVDISLVSFIFLVLHLIWCIYILFLFPECLTHHNNSINSWIWTRNVKTKIWPHLCTYPAHAMGRSWDCLTSSNRIKAILASVYFSQRSTPIHSSAALSQPRSEESSVRWEWEWDGGYWHIHRIILIGETPGFRLW